MNNETIDHPEYYQLPCGRDLLDFIADRGLNFCEGSALKYLYRAGHKDGESKEKDMAKASHYVKFYASLVHIDERIIRGDLEQLHKDAVNWDGKTWKTM